MLPLAAATSTGLTLPGLVGLVGGILGVIGIVASAAAVLRANYMRATIDTLKESNAALAERNDQLDDSMRACAARIGSLETENNSLKTYVSGTEAIHALGTQLKEQHAEAMARWAEVSEAMSAHLIVEHARRRPRTAVAKKATARKTVR